MKNMLHLRFSQASGTCSRLDATMELSLLVTACVMDGSPLPPPPPPP